MKQILKEGGASREFYMSELVSHVISDVPVDPEVLSFKGQGHVTVNVGHVTYSAYSTCDHVCQIVSNAVRLGCDVTEVWSTVTVS